MDNRENLTIARMIRDRVDFHHTDRERRVLRGTENVNENQPSQSVKNLDSIDQPKTPEAEAWIDATYSELLRLASSYLVGEMQTVSLSPTVLVHEVYVRMSKQSGVEYQSKSHFFAVASTMMRRILVDHARARSRTKRGGKYHRVSMDESLIVSTTRDADVLAMDEALQELAKLDERQARIVEMRFFGGMTVPEVAEALNLSTRTIEKEWQLSKAWLRKQMDESNQ